MSAKVNVIYSCGRVSQLKRSLAERKVGRGGFKWKDDFTIEEIRLDLTSAGHTKACYNGPLGSGNMVSFSGVRSKLLKPKRFHYEIPAVGARTRLLRVRDVNQFHGGIEC